MTDDPFTAEDPWGGEPNIPPSADLFEDPCEHPRTSIRQTRQDWKKLEFDYRCDDCGVQVTLELPGLEEIQEAMNAEVAKRNAAFTARIAHLLDEMREK